MKMTEEAKKRLRKILQAGCSVCNSSRSYTNPMARCSVCKKWFCYDHIRTNLEEKGIIDYCEEHYPE